MKKLTIAFCLILFSLVSCEKDPESGNDSNPVTSQRHFSQGDYDITNGRIVFKDWESWVDVMNNWNNPDSMNLFVEMIVGLDEGYQACTDFQSFFDTDTNDHLLGYFLNEDHLFQVDTTIMFWDLTNNKIRSIHVDDESTLIGDLIAGNDDPGIREAYLEYTNETTQRPYAACSYCALGAIAVGLGCPAGLLELYACYYCWANW